MNVRLATPSDVPAILAIERASPGAAHWSEREYAQIWDESAVSRKVFVAGDEEVLGFLVARVVAGEWELENIAVKPELRGQGIGSALVRRLLQWARDGQGTRMMLEVRESNTPARKLYEKLGLAVSGRRRDYYRDPTEDAILYDVLV